MRRAYPYALFFILVIVFLWKPIFQGKVLLPGDYLAQMSPWNTVINSSEDAHQWNPLQWDAIAQFYPWRIFYARSMSQGHIPLWNPHQFCGTPFLANGQSAVLYPPNLFFLILDPVTGFTLIAVLHLFMASSFMYMLMRGIGCRQSGSVLSAIVYTYSAFMVLWMELPTFICVAAWLPLIILLIHLAVEKRSVFYGMSAGLIMAVAVLAGHFQIAFYVAFAALLFWCWKLVQVKRSEGDVYVLLKVVAPFIGFIIIAGLIAAVQVLPTQELAANSHRVRQTTPEGYAAFIANAVKPFRLITAFVPDYFGSPEKGSYFMGSAADYIEYGLYAGILPIALALCSLPLIPRQRYAGFFGIIAATALLLATGSILNAPLYYLVPGFSALGGPNRVLLLYFFGLAAMSGFGLDYMAESASSVYAWRGRVVKAGLLIVSGALALLLMAVVLTNSLASNYIRALSGEDYAGVFGPTGSAFIAFYIISLLLLFMRSMRVVSRNVFAVATLAVVVADLFAFGINYNPTCERGKVYPSTPLTDRLGEVAKNARIAPLNVNWSLYQTPAAMLPPNAAMVYGFYDVQGYDSLYTRTYKDLSSRVQEMDSSPPENGNMVLMRNRDADYSEIASILVHDDGRISKIKGASPLFWGGDYHNLLSGTRHYERDARFSGPNRIDFKMSEESANFIGAGFMYYPGWVARTSSGIELPIDERDTPFLSAVVGNIKDKESRISFVFEPYSFRLGLFLTCLGAGLLAGTGVYHVMKHRPEHR